MNFCQTPLMLGENKKSSGKGIFLYLKMYRYGSGVGCEMPFPKPAFSLNITNFI